MPKKTDYHWLVYRGEAQWLAWKDWLTREKIQTKFWPDKLPVPAEWPPETIAAAIVVAEAYRQWREDSMPQAKGKKNAVHHESSGPAPEPWIRWSHTEMLHRVAEFNAQERS